MCWWGPLTIVVAMVTLVASLSACSSLVLLNDILIPADGYTVTDGLAYGNHNRQRLDVYVPHEISRPATVVVFFYGGSWKGGQRQYYRFVGEALTNRGYVVVVPDYRVYPDVRFPAFVDDGARAVAWVHAHIDVYGGAPDRIILMGHSAGAHIAALLAADPHYLAVAGVSRDLLRGFIGLAGPYAFDPFQYRSTRAIFEGLASPEGMQPVSFVSGDEARMLLLHGANDRTVHPVNSETLAAAVKGKGGDVRLVIEEGVGHIGLVLALAAPLRRSGGVLDKIDRFIEACESGHSTGAGPSLTGSDLSADLFNLD